MNVLPGNIIAIIILNFFLRDSTIFFIKSYVASLYFAVIPAWRKESPMKVGLSGWMGPTLFRYLCCKIGVQ